MLFGSQVVVDRADEMLFGLPVAVDRAGAVLFGSPVVVDRADEMLFGNVRFSNFKTSLHGNSYGVSKFTYSKTSS